MGKDLEKNTAIILSGGKCSRMGAHKAFLKVGERPIIESLLDRFWQAFGEVIVVVDDLAEYRHLPAKVIRDEKPDMGPLMGIYSGLKSSRNIHNFITACDTPFVNMGLVKFMISLSFGFDALVPIVDGRAQVLFSIYSKDCIRAIGSQLENEGVRVNVFLDKVRTKFIDEKTIRRYDPTLISFFNINSPEDLEIAKGKVSI